MRSWISACFDLSFCVKSFANCRFSVFSLSLNLDCQATQLENCLSCTYGGQPLTIPEKGRRNRMFTCWLEMNGSRLGHRYGLSTFESSFLVGPENLPKDHRHARLLSSLAHLDPRFATW